MKKDAVPSRRPRQRRALPVGESEKSTHCNRNGKKKGGVSFRLDVGGRPKGAEFLAYIIKEDMVSLLSKKLPRSAIIDGLKV